MADTLQLPHYVRLFTFFRSLADILRLFAADERTIVVVPVFEGMEGRFSSG